MRLIGQRRLDTRSGRREGSALALVLFSMIGLATVSLALLTITNASAREVAGARVDVDAFYAAEAAVALAVFDLNNGGTGELGMANQALSFGEARYWVENIDLGGGRFSLDAVAVVNGKQARVEVVLTSSESSFYQWAAFGEDGVTLDSNALVDSFDSSLGTYDSQDVNGSGQDRYALQNGHVGSNCNIGMDGNTLIYGDAHPGPSSTTTLTGSAVVSGSTSPSPSPQAMPPLVIPAIASSGPLSVSSDTTFAAGDYHYEDFELGGNAELTIIGPARYVFNSMRITSNTSITIDATNGPVEIYVLNDFVMNSNTQIASTTFTPADVTIFLESDNVLDPDIDVEVDGDPDDVEFDSNAMLFGTIYAPLASVEINSNFELFGALIARRVHLDSNSEIHFDEALLSSSHVTASSGYDLVCWRMREARSY